MKPKQKPYSEPTQLSTACVRRRRAGSVGRTLSVVTGMTIDAIFEEIRSLYFPRWDRQRRWTAVFGDDDQFRDSTGYCDTDAKTIYLDERSVRTMPEVGVRALLIHEICHDVGAAHHNRGWATRMEQAAKRAEELNESKVGAILRSDIYSHGGAGVLANFDLHTLLDYAEELIGEDPSMDCDTAVRRVARYFGHSPAKVKCDFGVVIQDVMLGSRNNCRKTMYDGCGGIVS